MMKRYIVDMYDAFDGWITVGMEPLDEQIFSNIDEARKYRDKKNAGLDKDNIMMGEHWGIIDTEINHEVECCQI